MKIRFFVERIPTLFHEQFITIVSIFIALFMTILTVVVAVTSVA